MNANEYQRLAGRTLIDAPDHTPDQRGLSLVVNALLLSADSGAVADAVKKMVCHQHGVNGRELLADLGEVHNQLIRTGKAIARPTEEVLTPAEYMHAWNALGLAGEAGEVCALVFAGQGTEVDRVKLKKELGDVLWYVAALCSKFGLDLGDVMTANIEKLRARYPEGYSAEASQQRNEATE